VVVAHLVTYQVVLDSRTLPLLHDIALIVS